jgi:hypothetical protein
VYVNLTESKCVFKKCIQKVYSKIEYTLCIEKYILKSVFKFEYTLCIHLRNSQNISSLLPNWRKFQIRENLLSSSKNRFCRKDVVAVFFFLVHSLPKTQKETEMYDIIPPEGPRESNRSQKKHLLLSLSEFSSCRPATDKTPCSPFSVPTFVFAISMPSGWPPRCCEQVPYPTSQ